MARTMTRFAALTLAFSLGTAAFSPALFADDLADKVNQLATATQTDRRTILKDLRDKGADAYDALVAGLTNKSAAVREDCARLLGALRDARAVEKLSAMLKPSTIPVAKPVEEKHADGTQPGDKPVDGAAPADKPKSDADVDPAAKPVDPTIPGAVRPDGTVQSPDEAAAAAAEAAKKAAAKTEPEFKEGAGEPVAAVRAAAATALGAIATAPDAKPDVVKSVAEALRPFAANAAEDAGLRYAALGVLADIASADDTAAMKGLLVPAGSPALGERAVGYFAKLPNGAGLSEIVAFLDAKKTVGEGPNAKSVWNFEGTPHSWAQTRTIATFALVNAKHAEALRFFFDEVTRNTRANSAVNDQFAMLSAAFGDQLGDKVVAWLAEESKKAPNAVKTEFRSAAQLLPKCGAKVVAGIVAAMEDGEKDRRAKTVERRADLDKQMAATDKELTDTRERLKDNAEELKKAEEPLNTRKKAIQDQIDRLAKNPEEGAINYFESVFGVVLEELSRDQVTRAEMQKIYAARTEPLPGTKDLVREKLFNVLLASRSAEGLLANEQALSSKDNEVVKRAIASWIEIQGGDGLEKLKPLVTHADAGVREALCQQLGSGRVPNMVAQPVLLDLSKDKDIKVAKAAWQSLGRTENPAIVDEFKRGMSSGEPESQYASAQAFSNVLAKLKLGDKKSKDLRSKVLGVAMDALKAGGGGAAGILDNYYQYNGGLFGTVTEDQDSFRKAARALLTNEDPFLRCAAGERMNELYDDDYLKAVRTQFMKEENDIAAHGMMQGLSLKTDKLTDKADLEAMLPKIIYWLGFNEGTSKYSSAQKMAAMQAQNLLAAIGRKDDNGGGAWKKTVTDLVRDTIRKEVDNRKSASYPPEADAKARKIHLNTAGYAIGTLQQLAATGESDLVLDACEAFNDAANMGNYIYNYLYQYAGPAQRDRIMRKEQTGMNEWQKDQIVKQIDQRNPKKS
jgi:hypothetical protein